MSGTPKKITALPQAANLPVSAVFPVSFDGETWKATLEQLMALTGGLQSLSYNAATGQLTISGANTVTIPLGPKMFVSEVTEIGGGTPVTFTHNLGTQFPEVSVWDADTNEKIFGRVVANTPDTLQITATVTHNVRVVAIASPV